MYKVITLSRAEVPEGLRGEGRVDELQVLEDEVLQESATEEPAALLTHTQLFVVVVYHKRIKIPAIV